jgi:hypothetical protein
MTVFSVRSVPRSYKGTEKTRRGSSTTESVGVQRRKIRRMDRVLVISEVGRIATEL